ncbi:echinoderm microtubule-associated protein [Phytophthora citrophthora]|uniref:Echinoderm microtubule-associated protein n=1 Tax=Phytophthora citrophthora TaxID=4793 RepID=A0AAD9GZM2_9STRA|nr:echinoderm microtubule-associated protein [Phytophthora citrophthora]
MKAEYCTVGDDQTIRVRCSLKKTQLRIQRLECVARACALTDSADIVAVGFGGRNSVAGLSKTAQAKTGGILVKAAIFDKHQSYITHLDFSADGQVLQSNCGAYELLFSNTATGKHITSASSTKDTQWHSWTCVLGWPVQGIWSPCSNGININAVCASSLTSRFYSLFILSN